MRKITLALLIPLAACGNSGSSAADDAPGIAGTGAGNARSYAAADFSRIDVVGPDDVDVRVGAGFSVRAEGDPDKLERVKIEKVGDTLRVGRRRQNGISWDMGDGVRVIVTLPRLAGVSLTGSGDMTVDRVEGSAFSGSLTGSGNLDLAGLAVEEAKLSLTGSGDLKAAGKARRLDLSVTGSGDAAAGDLEAEEAEVSVMGSGDARARVTGTARVNAMGSGDVELTGGARCTSRTMGSGEVRCGG